MWKMHEEPSMPLTVDIRDALDLKKLNVPVSLHVLKVDAEDNTDSTGEPALRVTVLLDESTDIENVPGDDIGDFKLAILDSLLKNGITLFPYFFFASKRACRSR
jgi:hypothetical protein